MFSFVWWRIWVKIWENGMRKSGNFYLVLDFQWSWSSRIFYLFKFKDQEFLLKIFFRKISEKELINFFGLNFWKLAANICTRQWLTSKQGNWDPPWKSSCSIFFSIKIFFQKNFSKSFLLEKNLFSFQKFFCFQVVKSKEIIFFMWQIWINLFLFQFSFGFWRITNLVMFFCKYSKNRFISDLIGRGGCWNQLGDFPQISPQIIQISESFCSENLNYFSLIIRK